MKVIFLDIDGVLNSTKWFDLCRELKAKDPDYVFPELDTVAISNLNWVIRETGALVVVSSSWRWTHPLPMIIQEWLRS